MKISNKKKEPHSALFLLIILYCSSWGLTIINPGLFWDDWHWSESSSNLITGYTEAGYGPFTYFLDFMYFNSLGPIVPRLTVFVLNGFSAVFLYHILTLQNILKLNKHDVFLISSLYSILPLNVARNAICTSNFILSVFLFNLAWLTLLRFKVSFVRNFVVFVLLFFSYLTPSLLPLTLLLFLTNNNGLHLNLQKISLINFLKRNISLILAPVLFIVFRLSLWKPHGIYASYNKIIQYNVFNILKQFVSSIKNSFISPYVSLITESSPIIENIIFLSVLLILTLVIFRNFRCQNTINNLTGLSASLFILLLSTFLYLLVNKLPAFSPTESRHQLLMGYGGSLFVFYILRLSIKNIATRNVAYVFICMSSILINNFSTLWYIQQYFIDLSLIQNIKFSSYNSELQTNNTSHIIEIEPQPHLSIFNFKYQTSAYVYTPQLNRAGFQENTYMGTAEDLKYFLPINDKLKGRFHLRNFKPKSLNPDILIVFKTFSQLNAFNTLTMLFRYHLNFSVFTSSNAKLLNIELRKPMRSL